MLGNGRDDDDDDDNDGAMVAKAGYGINVAMG